MGLEFNYKPELTYPKKKKYCFVTSCPLGDSGFPAARRLLRPRWKGRDTHFRVCMWENCYIHWTSYVNDYYSSTDKDWFDLLHLKSILVWTWMQDLKAGIRGDPILTSNWINLYACQTNEDHCHNAGPISPTESTSSEQGIRTAALAQYWDSYRTFCISLFSF